MGQLVSSPSRSRSARVSTPPLLRLPVEIVLLIRKQLDRPESIVALALTCKALYALFPVRQGQLGENGQRALLELLERDCGDRCYFCDMCLRLHASWPPDPSYERRHEIIRYFSTCSLIRLESTFHVGQVRRLSYQHARLAMNRHLYGAPCGIPLDRLSADFQRPNYRAWDQAWRARIIDGELFVRITHTIDNVRGGYYGYDFRSIFDQNYTYMFCQHRNPRELSCLRPGPLSAAPDKASGLFAACHDLPVHCTSCRTDISVTVNPRQLPVRVYQEVLVVWAGSRWWNRGRPTRTAWFITVVAYHNFGSCRSHSDPTWQAFTNRWRNGGRDLDIWPPGAIREKWLAAEAGRPGA